MTTLVRRWLRRVVNFINTTSSTRIFQINSDAAADDVRVFGSLSVLEFNVLLQQQGPRTTIAEMELTTETRHLYRLISLRGPLSVCHIRAVLRDQTQKAAARTAALATQTDNKLVALPLITEWYYARRSGEHLDFLLHLMLQRRLIIACDPTLSTKLYLSDLTGKLIDDRELDRVCWWELLLFIVGKLSPLLFFLCIVVAIICLFSPTGV